MPFTLSKVLASSILAAGTCQYSTLAFSKNIEPFAKQLDVAVLDMPTVFPQMHRDEVRAADHRGMSRGQDRGVLLATRLTEGGHMVDVHAESNHVRSIRLPHAPATRGATVPYGPDDIPVSRRP